jgi:hypothetical protein
MKLSCKWIAFALAVGFLPALTGCATILRGTGHGIGISSQPPGAEVIVDNQSYGVTPVSAKLRRKDNHHLQIKLEGYQPYEVILTRQTSGWVFGNILFGPGVLIGIAVDAISGGMYTLKPDQVSADLQTAQTAASVEDGTLFVVLVPNPDPQWEKIGQLQPTEE